MGLKPREFYKWPNLMENGSIRPATPLEAWNGDVEEILPRISYFGPAKKFRQIVIMKVIAYNFLILGYLGENKEEKICYVNA